MKVEMLKSWNTEVKKKTNKKTVQKPQLKKEEKKNAKENTISTKSTKNIYKKKY